MAELRRVAAAAAVSFSVDDYPAADAGGYRKVNKTAYSLARAAPWKLMYSQHYRTMRPPQLSMNPDPKPKL